MISPEVRARIRRLYFADHWTVGTIATELGVHRDTVKLALEAHRFARGPGPVRPSILDPFKPFIQETLSQHPRLRSTRLFEMVKARGYHGSKIQLRRYVRTVRPTPHREAYFRLETLPGEQAQVDWGHFGKIRVGGCERALSCFVAVLSYSRAMYARFSLDQSMESFLRGHVAAWEAFGGVPRVVLYDNLKSVVLERVGDHIRFHPSILELAGYYHFAPQPCAPYRANEKGKVERTIQYLRHSFFDARTFDSVSELNIELASWISGVAHERPWPKDPERRRPIREALEEEKLSLLSRPENEMSCDLVKTVRSGKTPYVRFDLNDYSIPHTLVRRPLTLVASEWNVRILDGTTEVARHRRSWGRGDVIEARNHLEALAAEKAHAHDLRGRDRVAQVCPSALRVLAELAQRNEPVRSHTAKLNRLLDHYGAEALERALIVALERRSPSSSSIAHILDQEVRRQGLPPILEPTLPSDQRVRDVHVRPHDLAAYDALASDIQEEP